MFCAQISGGQAKEKRITCYTTIHYYTIQSNLQLMQIHFNSICKFSSILKAIRISFIGHVCLCVDWICLRFARYCVYKKTHTYQALKGVVSFILFYIKCFINKEIFGNCIYAAFVTEKNEVHHQNHHRNLFCFETAACVKHRWIWKATDKWNIINSGKDRQSLWSVYICSVSGMARGFLCIASSARL